MFWNRRERDNGDIFWNGFPVEKIVDSILKINEDVYNVNDNIQNAFTNTSNISSKKLIDKDKEI